MTTFPTLSVQPYIQTPTEDMDPSTSSEMINLMRTTRRRATRVIQRWNIKYPAMPDSDLTTLKAFFRTVGGGAALFQWSDEFGNTYNVRFKSGLKHVSVTGGASAVEFEIEEV